MLLSLKRRFQARKKTIRPEAKLSRHTESAHVDLKRLQRTLGYRFKNQALLLEALTHRSVHAPSRSQRNTPTNRVNYERLEFLGDAVLSLAISTLFLRSEQNYNEGDLSKIRAAYVNEQTLASIARSVNLSDFLILGKSEEASGGRNKESILADVLEALMGAIYLDSDFDRAFVVVRKIFDTVLNTTDELLSTDYKTLLQEYAQEVSRALPEYQVIAEKGPGHSKTFEVAVSLAGKILGHGHGSSKKRASQEAAKIALSVLKEHT